MKKLMVVVSMIALATCLVGCGRASKFEGILNDTKELGLKSFEKTADKEIKKQVLKFKEMKESEQEEALEEARKDYRRAKEALEKLEKDEA